MEEKNIALRSEPMNEFLSRPPSWMLRYGLVVVFCLLVCLGLVAHFLRYSDVVKGNGVLITKNPPLHIITKSGGKIVQLYYPNGTLIKRDSILAEMESSANFQDLELLKSKLQETDSAALYKLAFSEDSVVQYGEINPPYLAWKKAVLDFQTFVQDKTTAIRLRNLQTQIGQNQALVRLSKQQLGWLKKELDLTLERTEAEQSLYKEGMTSKMDFYEKQKDYLNKQGQATAAEKGMVQLQMTITDQQKQVAELRENYQSEVSKLLDAIAQSKMSLLNMISTWTQSYIIRSAIDGKIAYTKDWQPNMNVKAQEDLFTIIPHQQQYLVAASIPTQNAGAVKVGQEVQIVNASFPEDKYGFLEGKVKRISLTPDQEKYRIDIALTNGLQTTFKKSIPYKPESNVSIDIVTEKMSLLDRLLMQIRKLLDKRI